MRAKKKIIGVSVIVTWLLVMFAYSVSAKVTEVIDKSNYQEVKDLVPPSVLEWLKKGDLTMKVGTPNWDIGLFASDWVLESYKENIGKYDLSKNDTIVETKTGKEAPFIKGIPFPKIDPNDPKGGVKVMWNGYYIRCSSGPFWTEFRFRLMNRGGLERTVLVNYFNFPIDGYAPNAGLPNPDGIMEYGTVVVKEPYDMNGMAEMDWRYKQKPQAYYGYVPAIRRVRRESPAERSDPEFGTDYCRDDGGWAGHDGTIQDFNWKILGKTEVLREFLNEDKWPCHLDQRREWVMERSKGKTAFAWGYETSGWTGAPWHITTSIWVKRPVWIIEGRPKDPYYNYGRTLHYVDTESFLLGYKVIYDRAGRYWKTLVDYWATSQSDDNKNNFSHLGSRGIDDRANRCTGIDGFSAGGKTFGQNYLGPGSKTFTQQDFTLNGFMKMCK